MYAAGQIGNKSSIKTVRVRGKGNRQICIVSCVSADFCKVAMQRRLPAAKADAEASACIEFIEPLREAVLVKRRRVLRREAMCAVQVACIRERDGNLSRGLRPKLWQRTDLFEKNIQSGPPIEK